MSAKPKNEPWTALSGNVRIVPLHKPTPCMDKRAWQERFVAALRNTPFGKFIAETSAIPESDLWAAANADWPMNCNRSPEDAAVEHGTPPT